MFCQFLPNVFTVECGIVKKLRMATSVRTYFLMFCNCGIKSWKQAASRENTLTYTNSHSY